LDLQKLRLEIEKKKEIYPLEWLGRSLAYTPYQPRCIKYLISREDSKAKSIFYVNECDDFLEFVSTRQDSCSAFILESLENLAYIRRYTQTPLIYSFMLIDSYQVLEALVYGCDCVVFRVKFVELKALKELSDFAMKLGLDRIFYIESKDDLTKAIFAKSDILWVENRELIGLIPNNKIIISKNIKDSSIDANIL
jgi:indole-3-glycerol phosphate synthase